MYEGEENMDMSSLLPQDLLGFVQEHSGTLLSVTLIAVALHIITTAIPRQLRKMRRMRSRITTALLASAIAGGGIGSVAGNALDSRHATQCPQGTVAMSQLGGQLRSQTYCIPQSALQPAPQAAPQPQPASRADTLPLPDVGNLALPNADMLRYTDLGAALNNITG